MTMGNSRQVDPAPATLEDRSLVRQPDEQLRLLIDAVSDYAIFLRAAGSGSRCPPPERPRGAHPRARASRSASAVDQKASSAHGIAAGAYARTSVASAVGRGVPSGVAA